jgi:hypothetical protein
MRGNIGVHASHCCKWHGCKYGDPDCPVYNGEVEQLYLCEDCYWELEDEEYCRERLIRIEEIKIFKDLNVILMDRNQKEKQL